MSALRDCRRPLQAFPARHQMIKMALLGCLLSFCASFGVRLSRLAPGDLVLILFSFTHFVSCQAQAEPVWAQSPFSSSSFVQVVILLVRNLRYCSPFRQLVRARLHVRYLWAYGSRSGLALVLENPCDFLWCGLLDWNSMAR